MIDDKVIIELVESVFRGRGIEHWNWKFKDNPYGGPIIYPIEEEEKVVGHYSGMPCSMNLLGKEIAAPQGIDAMVHDSYQGKGLFTILAANVYEACRDSGIKIVFGFPNQNTFPIVMRKFWEHIGKLKDFQKRIGFRNLYKMRFLDRVV